jgi:hypothetical protein
VHRYPKGLEKGSIGIAKLLLLQGSWSKEQNKFIYRSKKDIKILGNMIMLQSNYIVSFRMPNQSQSADIKIS